MKFRYFPTWKDAKVNYLTHRDGAEYKLYRRSLERRRKDMSILKFVISKLEKQGVIDPTVNGMDDVLWLDDMKIRKMISEEENLEKDIPNSGLTKFLSGFIHFFNKNDNDQVLFIIKLGEPDKTINKIEFTPGAKSLYGIKHNIKAEKLLEKVYYLIINSDEDGSKIKPKVHKTKYDFGITNQELTKDELENQLISKYNTLRLSDDRVKEAEELSKSISDKLKNQFKDLNVNLTGSLLTGLITNESDIDLNLSSSIERNYDETGNLLNDIKTELKTLSLTNIIIIHRKTTRVPLIKCFHKPTGFNLDLSLGSFNTMDKTLLIRHYSNLHINIKRMLLLIKAWATNRGIIYANNGTLNSFCHTLMALKYLTVKEIIPNLQLLCENHSEWDSKCTKDIVIGEAKYERCIACGNELPVVMKEGLNIYFNRNPIKINDPENNLSLIKLLSGYFDFIGNKVDWTKIVISMKYSHIVPRALFISETDALNELKLLNVTDPFEPNVNTAASGRPWALEAVKYEFQRAATMLENNQSADKLFERYPDLDSYEYIEKGIYVLFDKFS